MKYKTLALIVIGLGMSGCKIGNHVVNAPSANPVSGIVGDTTSGYYATQPQTYTAIATIGSTPTSKSVSPTNIPSPFSDIFSNPVAFKLLTDGQNAQIYDPIDGAGYQIPFTSGSTSFDAVLSGSQTLWDSPNCTLTETIELQGSLGGLGNTSPIVTLDGYEIQVSGRMALTVQLDYRFTGSACSTSLQEMYNCYQNVSNCMGTSSSQQSSNQQFVTSLFDPFIQANTMAASDIPNATGLAEEMQYQ